MKRNYAPSVFVLVAASFVLGLLIGRTTSSPIEDVEEIAVETTIPKTTTSTSTSSTTTTQAWNPSGYTVVSPSDGIAMRWLEDNEFDCDYQGDWCWGMEVISRWGCPSSLYVEISIKNKSGVNIGWTNDTAQGLGAGQKAQLIFGTYESQAETASLAEVSCY